ncbi:P-loop containing nucleoside triphosphate hydrolase protein [Dipodascopsis uninucleata]
MATLTESRSSGYNEKEQNKAGLKDDAEVDHYALLPPDEANLLRRQIHIDEPKPRFLNFYRYSTKFDIFMFFIGGAAAIIGGILLPLMTIIFGALTQTFTNYFLGQVTKAHFNHEVSKYALYFVYLGIGQLVFTCTSTFIFIDRGEVLSSRIRQRYLSATLRQNIGYFDKLGSGEITSRITSDTNLVQEGMSEKVSLVLNGLATFITAFVVGFIKSWKLTLIMCSVVLAIVLTLGTLSKFMVRFSGKSLEGYSVGGTIAEEVFASVRNVHAFGAQHRLAKEYDRYLDITEHWGLRQSLIFGLMIGLLWFYVYCNYALGFWQGSRFLERDDISVGGIISVLMSSLIGAFSMGTTAPNFTNITNGITACAKIYATIDRVPAVDATSDSGDSLATVNGDIELKNVKFIYPSRPDVTVLEDMNLQIEAGTTVALVGASGSGKSTIIGLLERFYLPVKGTITLDGHDISILNVRWLRQQIALVSQEPTLFACSVYENISYGLIGTEYENASDDVKRKLIIEACEQANAWDFIQTLPEGLETNVGERGFLMSGGQKQRIAIARAIVSNPKILLLDEATSALDTKSEGIVQDALDRASQSRTTIVIAHRLSTIKDADKIIVMSKGMIVEQGTHNELLDRKGMYYNLVEAQKIFKRNSDEDGENGTEEMKLELHEDSNIVDIMRTKSVQSVSSQALKHINKAPERTYSIWQLIVMLNEFSKPEKWFMVLGVFGAFINGVAYPVMSVLFAKCIVAFEVYPSMYPHMRSQINMFSGFYFLLAVVEGFAHIICVGSLGFVGQRLIHRIRYESFRQMLRQDISYFDRQENTTGALTSTLSKDAQSVEGLSGATLGQIINSIVTIIVGIILSLSVAWKLALVCTACMPILIGCGFIRFWILAKFQERAKKSYDDSASYACESASAIRTVVSLTREEGVLKKYTDAVESQVTSGRWASFKSAFLYGCSQSLALFVMALGFWFGSTQLASGKLGTTQFFITFSALIFGAQSAGTVFSFAPDMGKAKQAAINIHKLFDSIPLIDSWSDEGIVPETVTGDIEFKDVHFRYPTRPEVPVLRGLDLTIKSGQYVALVGSSGCGKSTTISLIESFYSPLSGQILLDGVDIASLNVTAYREHIALVSQEPTLYAGSIKYNIKLGASRDVTDEEIIEACKQANIHDFITSLPDGYDTLCGSRGALLSGGQKQRIAIARALIRQPRILLLDEATSALDSESEKIVQAALDAAAKGRTTIAVAHRLSTIQNADVIYVFENGKILESGTHQELIDMKSKYYELVKLQALERNA